MRRRMQLRRTAPQSAFFTLQPNRLMSSPLARRNTVNSRPELRRPSRYTASYSARRRSRQARGNPNDGELDARETVAPLFAALRKNFAATLAFHSRAKAVLFVTGAHMGLKGSFRQRFFSSARVFPVSLAPGHGPARFSEEVPRRIRESRTQAKQTVYATGGDWSRKDACKLEDPFPLSFHSLSGYFFSALSLNVMTTNFASFAEGLTIDAVAPAGSHAASPP
jgi:hypothetical protein